MAANWAHGTHRASSRAVAYVEKIRPTASADERRFLDELWRKAADGIAHREDGSGSGHP